jgi:hypothetical protein
MKLRRFTDSGIEQFRIFLAKARENANVLVPVELLEDDAHTEVVDPEIEIEDQSFATRADAATYFHAKLAVLNADDVNSDSGMWSWLSLYYFDQVCPVMNGRRTVRNDYTYIYEAGVMRHFYRHLLYVAWRIKQIAPTHNRLFLHSKVHVMDKVTTEVMKRLYLTRIPAIFEAIDRLYWNETSRGPRTSIVNPRKREMPGDLTTRLPIRLRQLEKTYDLYSLSADQLLELLGEEFALSPAN